MNFLLALNRRARPSGRLAARHWPRAPFGALPDAAVGRRTLLLATLATPAIAQPWRPERPVEIIVGFAPGGGTDLDARSYGAAMERVLGVPFVVNNRAGAGGEVALAAVARARPDGTTLGTTNMPGIVTIPIERRAQFHLNDFAPIANLVTDPSAITVHAQSPFQTLADIINRAREAPDVLTYASPGVGTDDHLQLVLLMAATGIRITNVNYAGDAPMRTALLGRQVDMMGLNLGASAQNRDNTRIVAHAGATRSRFAPDVPTLRELGFDITMASERGIVAPAATPAAILERLREATATVAQDAEFRRQIESRSTEPLYEAAGPWFERLRAREADYRRLWQTTPWSG